MQYFVFSFPFLCRCVFWMFHKLRASAVHGWVRDEQQERPAARTCGQRLHVEQKSFITPGQIAFHTHLNSPSFPILSIKLLVSSFFPVSICLCHSCCLLTYMIPITTLSFFPSLFPSAQSHHTGSLFLANLSLIHYWDLFFFLGSQNKEGEQIFWIFNAPHKKCIISAIRTGKLLTGHNTPSHEMTPDREENHGQKPCFQQKAQKKAPTVNQSPR